MYMPIRKQLNIMSIKGGFDTKVVFILLCSLWVKTESKLESAGNSQLGPPRC